MPRDEKGLGRLEVAPSDPKDRVEGVRYFTPSPEVVEEATFKIGDRVRRTDGRFDCAGTVRDVLVKNRRMGSVVVVEWDEDIPGEPAGIFGDLRTCTNDPTKLVKV